MAHQGQVIPFLYFSETFKCFVFVMLHIVFMHLSLQLSSCVWVLRHRYVFCVTC